MNMICESKKVFLSILFGGITLSLCAHEKQKRNAYFSEELRTIAVRSNIASISDTLGEGIHYGITVYKKKPITIIVEDNEVKHIGYSIFTRSTR